MQFKDATLAKDYAAINDGNGFKSAADTINFINNHDFSTASPSDVATIAGQLAIQLNLPEATVFNMIQTQSFKTEPTTTTVGGKVSFPGYTGSTTSTKTKGGNSSSSNSSGSSVQITADNPGGI